MFLRRFFGERYFGDRWYGDGRVPPIAPAQVDRRIRSLTLFEMDLDRCSLTYGVAPCMAALGVTGTTRCFNTRRTCQDRENFNLETETLRFAKATAYLPQEFDAIPNIEAIEYDPGIISLGENMGQRASLTVTFKDHPWSDTNGYDPYRSTRGYDPYRRGTHWGKFRARQPFVQGRPSRWIDGKLGQALDEMDVRHFVMESISGPSTDGRFRVTSKDVLKLADDDRAQAPALSSGRLAGPLDLDDTTATLTPTGIGDEEYEAEGYLNIGGKEIVGFTRSGDTLTITRGELGTDPAEHQAQDRVQTVLRYASTDPADIIYDLLTTYAGIDTSHIDLEAWQAETDANYRRLMTGTVAEPTGVNELVSEIIQQAALAVWWEPLTQQIRLQVLRAINTEAERFTPSNTITGSLAIKEQPDKRLSQVWVYYGQRNPLGSLDDPTNYRAAEATIQTDAENDYGAPKIKKIFSRWIPAGGSSVAQRLGDILLAQYKDPPRRFSFRLARHAAETPTLGEGCRLQAQPLQDETGAPADVPIQITRLKITPAQYEVEAEENNFAAITEEDLDNRQITFSADDLDLNLRTSHDEVYPAPVAGDQITFVVESWVVIGSSSTGTPALDTGDWPSVDETGTLTSGSPIITGLADTGPYGVGMAVTGAGIPNGSRILTVDSSTQITLDQNATASGSAALKVWTVIVNLYVRGRVQGAGGKGGKGASWKPTSNPTAGGAGGTALRARSPINLFLDEGLARIWGGGGGGGGADVLNLDQHRGGGGGGGAGSRGGGGGEGPGNAEDGNPGTLDAGGTGGRSYASMAWYEWPEMTSRRGGTGGAPGQAGSTGQHHGGNSGEKQPGAGGAAGKGIDGASFCNKTGSGDIRGGEIN